MDDRRRSHDLRQRARSSLPGGPHDDNPARQPHLAGYAQARPLAGSAIASGIGTRERACVDCSRRTDSMGSIKRDVKKKVLPRPDAEKLFVSRSSPLPVSVPLDLLERFVLACLPFPWLFIFRW